MAVVNTIQTTTQFASEFNHAGPSTFTVAALEELFYHLEELSENIGEDIEMDPVALRCDWDEYTDAELMQEFSDRFDLDPDDQAPELADKLREEGCIVIEVMQYIQENTWLVQGPRR
jgi:hypothetical protein